GAVRVGARARPEELESARARQRGHERPPADAGFGEAGTGARVRLRACGEGGATQGAARARPRGVRADRARVLPLLPEPDTTVETLAPLCRGGQGAREEGALKAC